MPMLLLAVTAVKKDEGMVQDGPCKSCPAYSVQAYLPPAHVYRPNVFSSWPAAEKGHTNVA